ncbi:hypothetical protein K493DRAFT_306243 [Basidiobolus meristosporus CBS 931.73]|uniref:Uncharacterized protein n=1 Tax=Basidiobolus meristosporus CBS 931.73 TaxID=1314790 RepID=A0A1Y1XUA0_9FUNG|nr:hypothetical protein K493DRAFT_306243 [Basidiobolus meristosporus CBS 931.73]|eukprot:ORX88864.1 hypothetical protein K493DRAFT_306243 [Basidiobolus meristosporus CBS 931.73]
MTSLLKKVTKNEKGSVSATSESRSRSPSKAAPREGKLGIIPVYRTFRIVDTGVEPEKDFEDDEALANQLIPELQRLRIENQYLFEQNRAVSRELGQAKLTAQALRQIISQKDEELSRVRSENRRALVKVCSLEGMLYKSTARQRSSPPVIQTLDPAAMEFEDDDDEEPLTPPSKGRIPCVGLMENGSNFASVEYDGFSAVKTKHPFDFVKATNAILRNSRN